MGGDGEGQLICLHWDDSNTWRWGPAGHLCRSLRGGSGSLLLASPALRARLRRILAGWPAHPSDLPGKAGTITLAAFGWAQVSTKATADWGGELNPHIPMRGACQRICVHTESSALIPSLKNFDIYSLTFTELIPQDSVAGSGRAQWTGCNHTHFTDEATGTCQGLRPSERAGTSPVGSS